MTPSESGAFAIFYAFTIGAFVYKELTWDKFKTCVIDSVKDLSVITMILAFSGIFSYGVVYDQLPAVLAKALVGFTDSRIVLLWSIIILLTICGMFMETTVITLIITPILLPVIRQFGIDPVHFGIVMMTTVTMGCSTPPVGVALYTCSSIMNCSVQETTRYAIPWFVAIFPGSHPFPSELGVRRLAQFKALRNAGPREAAYGFRPCFLYQSGQRIIFQR